MHGDGDAFSLHVVNAKSLRFGRLTDHAEVFPRRVSCPDLRLQAQLLAMVREMA